MFIVKKYFTKVLAIFLYTFIVNNQSLKAQQYQEGKYGANIGILVAFGTHFDRFGVVVNSYYQNNHFQINPELRLYFNFKNLGPKSQHIEAVTSIGILYGYGTKKVADTNYFFSTIGNQTPYKNSVGYSFNAYFNTIKTTQQTGIISLQFNKFSVITENDLFARPKLDQFRTGAILLQYQKDEYQFGINTTLFTGKMGNKITDGKYPYSHLYKDTTGGKYTRFSHGLLSAQIKYAGNYYQTYQTSFGFDSEKVRHTVQNRLIHDVFNSKKHKNAHIPMLDIEGDQYLFKKDQKIKPARFYMNGFINPFIFY